MDARREHAQTDTVNHPSIHWLTPLCTHSVSISHRRENYVSLPVLSQITPVFAHWFWSVLLALPVSYHTLHRECFICGVRGHLIGLHVPESFIFSFLSVFCLYFMISDEMFRWRDWEEEKKGHIHANPLFLVCRPEDVDLKAERVRGQ